MNITIRNEDMKTMDVFLSRGFSINAGTIRVVNIHEDGWDGHDYYTSNPDFSCVERQLKGYSSNPIMNAVRGNNLSLVKELIERGAKISIPILPDDSDLRNWARPKVISLVEYARNFGHEEIAEYLEATLKGD